MSKIDIAIKYTSAGAGEPISTSSGVWVSYVRDVRDVFQYLNGVDDGKVVTFMSFCKAGSLITLIRPISGRGAENVAAWIYVPTHCDISGEDLSAVVEDVKALLGKPSISIQDIQPFASKEYPTKPIAIDYTPSVREGAYAFRKTDFYPITDILGRERYQDYYTQFKGIIILDVSDSVTPAISMKDLTRMPIETLSVLIPPPPAMIESVLGPDASLLYQTPMGFLQFKEPIKIKEGSSVTLLAFKKGFDKIPILVTSKAAFQNFDFPAGFSPVWKKTLTRNHFKVLDVSNVPIQSARIVINGVDLAVGPYSMTEEDIKNAKLSVTASGYEPYEGAIRFANNDTVVVTLNKMITGNQYHVLSKGNEYEILLPGEADKTKSPLQGYAWGEDDTLVFAGESDKKSWWQAFAIGFAAASVLALLIWAISSPRKPKEEVQEAPEEPQTEEVIQFIEEEPVVQEPVVVVDTRNARLVSYLKGNEVWEQDSLTVNCPGLFEAMNSYNYAKVKNLLGPYNDIPRVKRLLDAMENPVKKSGTYCIDGVITLSTYISRITPEPKETSEP